MLDRIQNRIVRTLCELTNRNEKVQTCEVSQRFAGKVLTTSTRPKKKAPQEVPSIKQVLPTAKQKSTSNFVRTPFAYCRVVA